MKKSIFRLAIGTCLFLLIPLALTIRDGNVPNVGWNWSPGDFIFAFVLIFGTGMAYQILLKKVPGNWVYKAAAGIALLTGFALIWINAAVGIVGEGPINMLYVVAVLIGISLSLSGRLEPTGMSRALFSTAFVVALIPFIALIIGMPDFSPGTLRVFFLNSVFVLLFISSGILFRRANVIKTV